MSCELTLSITSCALYMSLRALYILQTLPVVEVEGLWLTGSNRLVGSCHKKCIAPDDAHRYHEGDLLKGEAVCIDRCTAKFFEVSPSLR